MATDEPNEREDESESKPTDPHERDGAHREDYSLHYANPRFRHRFNQVIPKWCEFNALYFANRLTRPRFSIGRTANKRLSETRSHADYGARTNIVISDRVAFSTDRRLVLTNDPDAPGLLRFIYDRLLGEMVKQCVMEVEGSLEEGWDGYGPLYAREATRIGALMGQNNPAEGLPEVHPRRRGPHLAGLPVAASWPHAFRPDDYYLGHVSLDPRGNRFRAGNWSRKSVIPGLLEYLHFLALTGKSAQLLEVLGRAVDAAKIARTPALVAFERSPRDASGKPLPVPPIDPAWLSWNAGCVRAIAEGIRTRRAFDGMPILADALQDAGCDNEEILRHCRAPSEHTAGCWCLRLLLTEPDQP